ncbi:conserved hypothetical protein (plasmid) [Borreliella burgdorferi 64b]|nr:conserved hypothetical protein [Borreliella burgdorferi 64b]
MLHLHDLYATNFVIFQLSIYNLFVTFFKFSSNAEPDPLLVPFDLLLFKDSSKP